MKRLKTKKKVKTLNKQAVKTLNKQAVKTLNKQAVKTLNKQAVKTLNKQAVKTLNKQTVKTKKKVKTLNIQMGGAVADKKKVKSALDALNTAKVKINDLKDKDGANAKVGDEETLQSIKEALEGAQVVFETFESGEPIGNKEQQPNSATLTNLIQKLKQTNLSKLIVEVVPIITRLNILSGLNDSAVTAESKAKALAAAAVATLVDTENQAQANQEVDQAAAQAPAAEAQEVAATAKGSGKLSFYDDVSLKSQKFKGQVKKIYDFGGGFNNALITNIKEIQNETEYNEYNEYNDILLTYYLNDIVNTYFLRTSWELIELNGSSVISEKAPITFNLKQDYNDQLAAITTANKAALANNSAVVKDDGGRAVKDDGAGSKSSGDVEAVVAKARVAAQEGSDSAVAVAIKAVDVNAVALESRHDPVLQNLKKTFGDGGDGGVEVPKGSSSLDQAATIDGFGDEDESDGGGMTKVERDAAMAQEEKDAEIYINKFMYGNDTTRSSFGQKLETDGFGSPQTKSFFDAITRLKKEVNTLESHVPWRPLSTPITKRDANIITWKLDWTIKKDIRELDLRASHCTVVKGLTERPLSPAKKSDLKNTRGNYRQYCLAETTDGNFICGECRIRATGRTAMGRKVDSEEEPYLWEYLKTNNSKSLNDGRIIGFRHKEELNPCMLGLIRFWRTVWGKNKTFCLSHEEFFKESDSVSTEKIKNSLKFFGNKYMDCKTFEAPDLSYMYPREEEADEIDGAELYNQATNPRVSGDFDVGDFDGGDFDVGDFDGGDGDEDDEEEDEDEEE